MYPLVEGEELLWSGRPQGYPRRYVNYHGYVSWAVLYVVMEACAFVVAWVCDVPAENFTLLPVLLMVPLALALERNRQRKALVGALTYLVTDRRLIFAAQGSGGIEFRWVWRADLREPRVHRYPDGTGTVDFRPTLRERLRDQQTRAQSSLLWMVPELVAIKDPERVAGLFAAAGSPALAQRSES
ncbi:hypothetical protein [Amycolatopsis benzoatilytica]|uniref:hypothetical protein n=1 Tax=Amycolatopsis benzoatilytica TaxID=346045 RepID=UPI00036AF25A|nr:hypothetical protein [Amycolatopsis benzoatilytica]